jgi:hypothetical protein
MRQDELERSSFYRKVRARLVGKRETIAESRTGTVSSVVREAHKDALDVEDHGDSNFHND